MLTFLFVGTARPDSPPSPTFHLVSFPAQHVDCVLTYTATVPHLTASEWLVIAPQPENSPAQSVCRTVLTIETTGGVGQTVLDQSAQQRPVLESSVDVDGLAATHTIALSATYDVSLNSRWLEPGASDQPAPPLSPVEKVTDTEPTPTTDFTSPVFQAWLSKYQLRRRADEDDLTFARRAFDTIRALYTYHFDPNQDRRASAVCGSKTADCGGLSNLFVAVLRQSRVPARLDVGRWVFPGTTDNGLNDVHVKSEFFADGIGWTPVEMSGAVSDKTGDAELYFGRDTGQFLTLSVNTDYVIDAAQWGTKRLLALQGICCWGAGTGDFSGYKDSDNWTVAAVQPGNPGDGAAVQTAGNPTASNQPTAAKSLPEL